MITKRALAKLFKLHAEYDATRQELAPLRAAALDTKSSMGFEQRMEVMASSRDLNELREHLFPQIREVVFSLPEGEAEDLKARYLELDEQRANVQDDIRGLTIASPSHIARNATSQILGHVQTNVKIGDDAIVYLKQITEKKKKNGT